jgi:PAS domain S-box-containing protein
MVENSHSDPFPTLRERAEEVLRRRSEEVQEIPPEELQGLVHELGVHQIELEIQNEELRRAQAELSLSRDAYLDLYDLAPVGYLTLSEKGLILRANLTLATMLGVDRGALAGQRLSQYILDLDQDAYYLYRRQLFAGQGPHSWELRVRTVAGRVIWVGGEAVLRRDDQGELGCFLALADITERKLVEEALQRTNDRLKSLREIDEAVLAAKSPASIAEAALSRLCYLTNCRRASLSLLDLDAQRATLLAAVGAGVEESDDEALDPEPVWLPPLRRGEPFVWSDSSPSAAVSRGASKLADGIRAVARVPLRSGDELVGSLNLHFAEPHELVGEVTEGASEAARPLAVAIRQAQLYESARQAREQLRDLARYLQVAREEERKRLAYEVQEEFGQTLAALNMDLAWLARRLPVGATELTARASRMAQILNDTLQTVKRISAELRPGLLDDLGLVPAMEWQVGQFRERTGIACSLRVGDGGIPLKGSLATAVFRIFQETLTNVAWHSGASVVRVSLDITEQEIELTVIDNGQGLSEGEASDPASLGLASMRERAGRWGGDLQIWGTPGRGTRMQLRLPLQGDPAP